MNEYFKKGFSEAATHKMVPLSPATSQSVILPRAPLWYLIKAKLHHSTGKGRAVRHGPVCTQTCVQEERQAPGREVTDASVRVGARNG